MIGAVRMPLALIALAVGLFAPAACGSQRADEDEPVGKPSADVVPDDYSGRFRATSVTVLSSPDHGPQLCSAVAESYPPQCGGPDIVGWDWSVAKHQSAHGTTWGTYSVVGTFEDGVFTLTEPPGEPLPSPPNEPDPVSACPEPPGGWQVLDPSKATPDDMERAISTAHRLEGNGGGWIGWLIPDDEITEQTSQDPDNFVINVAVSVASRSPVVSIREVWGGNLCVAKAEHTARELNEMASQIAGDVADAQSIWTDDREGWVGITVWVATEDLWARLAAEYGADSIRLDGILQPIDERHE
jgi:hypothetical protein